MRPEVRLTHGMSGWLMATLLAQAAASLVSFPTADGGIVHADVYGAGDRGLVLAHGGRFTKESWQKQAPAFVKAGFHVLAIDFRGRGQSKGGPQPNSADEPHHDVA